MTTVCNRCKKLYHYTEEDTFWDTTNATPVKIVLCPECGAEHIIKFEKDRQQCRDRWYYEYNTKLWAQGD